MTADEVWDLFRKFTKRFSFRDEGGADAVRSLLDTYGGTRIVHGPAPFPICWARSAPRTARTAPALSSRDRTSTPTAWPSRWTAA
ncbi:hypothetical protein SGLAM104S_10282 [Streptomyces glaucescens]